MLGKAPSYGAQGLVPDLEDSVPPAEKERAREAVASALPELAVTGRPVIPRINSLSSGLAAADIHAVVGRHVTGISIGKIRSDAEIRAVDEIISQAESKAGVEQGSTGILPWLESAAAVVNAFSICTASPRVRWVAFGAEDFTADMGIARDVDAGKHRGDDTAGIGEAPLLYPRSAVAVAARAAGVFAMDTPYVMFRDQAGLEREAVLARSLGFKGKLAIHPSQLETIARVFAPAPSEIERARRVVDAWEEAARSGKGAVSLDGEMIDVPVVERARSLLREAGLDE